MVAAETSNLNSTKLTNKLPKKLNSWILDQFFSQLFVDLSWSFDPVCANFLCCSGNESIIIILLLVHSNCCRNEFLTVTIFEWQIQSRIPPPPPVGVVSSKLFPFCFALVGGVTCQFLFHINIMVKQAPESKPGSCYSQCFTHSSPVWYVTFAHMGFSCFVPIMSTYSQHWLSKFDLWSWSG